MSPAPGLAASSGLGDPEDRNLHPILMNPTLLALSDPSVIDQQLEPAIQVCMTPPAVLQEKLLPILDLCSHVTLVNVEISLDMSHY